MNKQENSLIKILESFAFETLDAIDSQDVMEKYLKDFPQFADELKSFAIEKDLLKFTNLKNISEAEVERHLQASRNSLDIFLESLNSEAAEIQSLYETAKAKGMKKAQLKKRLGISTSLLVYLEKRRLEFKSIPKKLITRVADVLEQTENAVSDYLNQASDFAGQASFKTSGRPQIGKQKTFAEAIREDQELTPQQKRELLELSDK